MRRVQRETNGAIAASAAAKIDLHTADRDWQNPMENEDRDLDRLDIVSLLLAAMLAALVLLPTFEAVAEQMHLH